MKYLERKNLITVILVVIVALVALNLDNITGRSSFTGTTREPTARPTISIEAVPSIVHHYGKLDIIVSVLTPNTRGFERDAEILDSRGGREFEVELACGGPNCLTTARNGEKVSLIRPLTIGKSTPPGTYTIRVFDRAYQDWVTKNFEIRE